MSEDTMVNSPSSTTPTSTTVDLPSPSTGKEPSTTTSSATSMKDTIIALDKMLRYALVRKVEIGQSQWRWYKIAWLKLWILAAEIFFIFTGLHTILNFFVFFRSCISYILVPQFPTTGYQLESMSLEELQNFPLVSFASAKDLQEEIKLL